MIKAAQPNGCAAFIVSALLIVPGRKRKGKLVLHGGQAAYISTEGQAKACSMKKRRSARIPCGARTSDEEKEVKGMRDSFLESVEPLPESLRAVLLSVGPAREQTQEIRLRLNKPVTLFDGKQSLFLSKTGSLSQRPGPGALITDQKILEECLIRLCGYSVHSHQHEIAQGFVTTAGGDRVGLCACMTPGPAGKNAIRNVSSLNLRISREVTGAAREMLRTADPMRGILLAGAPGSGKTTVLRDAARGISSGEWGPCRKVALIDERYELSASGTEGHCKDVGLCTDVLCGVPKAVGISRAVRTLSPELIVCDEVASLEEAQEIRAGLYCGVAFLVSAHCASIEDARSGPIIRMLMETGAFSKIVLLEGAGTPSKIRMVITREEYDAF